jgi:hypothetical protein
MNLFSYSLYGDNLKYTVGAIKNAIIAEHMFPDFDSRFYVGKSVPAWVVQTLSLMPRVEIASVDGPENHTAMYWRFLAFADTNFERVVIKDADARLGYRDRVAHDEWIASDLDFHIVKDHPTGHSEPIIGCHFGAKRGALADIAELMAGYTISNQYGSDQWFLRDKVYERAIKSALVHDEYYGTQVEEPSRVALLPKRDWTLDHIGVAVDENDEFTYDIDRQTAQRETGDTRYAYNFGAL